MRGGALPDGSLTQDIAISRLPTSDVIPRSRKVHAMLDLLFLAIAVAFFAIAWAYAHACDRM